MSTQMQAIIILIFSQTKSSPVKNYEKKKYCISMILCNRLWVLPDSSKQKAIHVAELYNTESENTCNV